MQSTKYFQKKDYWFLQHTVGCLWTVLFLAKNSITPATLQKPQFIIHKDLQTLRLCRKLYAVFYCSCHFLSDRKLQEKWARVFWQPPVWPKTHRRCLKFTRYTKTLSPKECAGSLTLSFFHFVTLKNKPLQYQKFKQMQTYEIKILIHA